MFSFNSPENSEGTKEFTWSMDISINGSPSSISSPTSLSQDTKVAFGILSPIFCEVLSKGFMIYKCFINITKLLFFILVLLVSSECASN